MGVEKQDIYTYICTYVCIYIFPLKRHSNGNLYFSAVLLFSASDEESYFKKLTKKDKSSTLFDYS